MTARTSKLNSFETLESRQLFSGAAPADALAVAADWNGDGRGDLAIVGGAAVHVLLGNGDGTFSSSQTIDLSGVPGQTLGVAAGDFNGDSVPDLVVYNGRDGNDTQGIIAILIGYRSPTQPQAAALKLEDCMVSSFAGKPIAGDFNGDGRDDLAVAQSNGIIGVLIAGAKDGHTTFQTVAAVQTPYHEGDSVAAGDINGDGRDELLIGTYGRTTGFVGSANGGVWRYVNTGTTAG